MVFTYPALVKKTDQGQYQGYFPDLTMCEFKGEDLDSALEDARDSMYEWIRVELEEEDEPDLPAITDPAAIDLQPGESVHEISIHYRFSQGWDE